jgi:DNA-binding IclR family transcriptional regulator
MSSTTRPTELARRPGRPKAVQADDVPARGDKTVAGGVDAVDRALSLLSCFTEDDASLTLGEISARTGHYKSTVLRLAASLQRAGYLIRKPDKTFVLGPELMRLGTLYQRAFRLGDHVRPIMARLLDETGESITFSRRERDVRVCLFRMNSRHVLRDHLSEGDILPLDQGAAGLVLTKFEAALGNKSELDRLIKSLPFRSAGERAAGLASIAAPVFWAQPGLAGAVGISGPVTRFTPANVAQMTRHLLRAAHDMSEALGGLRYWGRQTP